MYVCRRVSIIVSQLPGYPLGQKRKNKNHRTMQTYPCRFVVSDMVLEVFHLTGSRNIGGNSRNTTPRRTSVYVSMFVEVHPCTRGKVIPAIGSCSVLPPCEKMWFGHMQSNNQWCAFFVVSKQTTTVLQASLRSGKAMRVADHKRHGISALKAAQADCENRETKLLSSVLAALQNNHRRTLIRIIDGGASGWFTLTPLASEGFDLLATQFQDQLALLSLRTSFFPNKL